MKNLINKYSLRLLLIAVTSFLFVGWGGTGHSIISYRTIYSAQSQMSFFSYWADSLRVHASDADSRKGSDPTEGPKHYIDIDNYPEFLSTGRISQDFDSLVALHGLTFVMSQGTLPWAILNSYNSLILAFQNNNWSSATFYASDLGHYVADAHMPLHLTRNYDGQFTGQSGVHSRYESSMINTYSSQIIYGGDSLVYIDNVPDYVFNLIYDNYKYLDSVLIADNAAKLFAGGTSGTLYYQKLWELSKSAVHHLFKNGSNKLASLIYTAWLNGGHPLSVDEEILADNFNLYQNYPNPFNPTTKIRYRIAPPNLPKGEASGRTTLKVYDVLGNEVATLVDEFKPAGDYEVEFNVAPSADGGSSPAITSGVYFYQLKAGSFSQTKKMILMK